MKLNENINLYTPKKIIKVPAKRTYLHESIKTYLHRPIGATENYGWTISEYTTGLAITNGCNTIRAAIVKAEENIKRVTVDEILKLISQYEKINV